MERKREREREIENDQDTIINSSREGSLYRKRKNHKEKKSSTDLLYTYT